MKDSEFDEYEGPTRLAEIAKKIEELDARIAKIENIVKRNSKALTVVESTVGLDLMLAKIIIDR